VDFGQTPQQIRLICGVWASHDSTKVNICFLPEQVEQADASVNPLTHIDLE